jgi:PAS domain S-box-containing protein
VRKADGELLNGLFSAQIISLQHKQCLLTTFLDISDRKRFETALINSEERYRRLFEMESDSVVMIDIEGGRFIDVNSAAIKMYGYSREEFLQLRHVDLSAEPVETIAFINSKGSAVPLRWHKNKMGTIFPVEIAGSYFEYQGREVHVAAVRDISERVRTEERLVELNKNLQALSEHAQKVQENERLAIARDIHDDLGQNLTVLKLDLEWIENRMLGNSVEFSERICEMRDSIEKLTASVHQIAGNLRPPLLDNMGLVAAIEWQTDEFRRRNGIECYLLLNEDVDLIHQNIATSVMRIIQEAFTNVVRHARATEVSLSLCITNGILILEISDNGCGITSEQIQSPFSYGVMGMRERVRICHGELVIQETHGHGTSLYITIPLDSGEQSA